MIAAGKEPMMEDKPSKEALDAARLLMWSTVQTLKHANLLPEGGDEMMYANAAHNLDAHAAAAIKGDRARIVAGLQDWNTRGDGDWYEAALGDVADWLKEDTHG